jgi:hypothetical protein
MDYCPEDFVYSSYFINQYIIVSDIRSEASTKANAHPEELITSKLPPTIMNLWF